MKLALLSEIPKGSMPIKCPSPL
jgi:hypothetical protein